MKNKIIIAGIIVLVVVFGYIAFGKKSESVATPAPKNDAANLKTYTNAQYGFQFKHPATSQVIGIDGPYATGSGNFEVTINYIYKWGSAPSMLTIYTSPTTREGIRYKNANTFSGDNSVGTAYEGENPIHFMLSGRNVYANCINLGKESTTIDFCNQVLATFEFIK